MKFRKAVCIVSTQQVSWSRAFRFTLPLVLFLFVVLLQQSSLAQNTPEEVTRGTAKLVQPTDPKQMLRVVLGLERPHVAEEEQFLQDLHTKGTKDYRHFLTLEEWTKRFGPSKQDEQAVIDWAKSQGLRVTSRYPHRLVVDLEAPVSVLEKAFNVKINNYQIGTKIHLSNDRDPEIAGRASSLVHSIDGLNDIQVLEPGAGRSEPVMPIYSPGPVRGQMLSGGANGSKKNLKEAVQAAKQRDQIEISNNALDPTDLYGSNAYDFNALYAQGHCCNPFNITGGTPPVTSIAIATAGSQNVNDFSGFQNLYPYLAYHYFTIPINGNPPCCDQEGTLDFEWATAMSNSFGALTNTSSVYIYQGVNSFSATFTTIYSQMLADGHARIMNVSWGGSEGATGNATMDTDHGIFNAMVGQGWTLVGISHDFGATADCTTLSASYPGSDPDLVSAGGTTLSLFSNSTYQSEVAWTGGTARGSCAKNNGGGGGGCSAHFSAPNYQGGAPVCGAGSRSVPDISLNAATGMNYFFNGAQQAAGGTSFVAPQLSGFFAQANAYLYWENVAIIGNSCTNGSCAPIGNANYYIYDAGLNSPYAAHYPFYDITSGCNSNDVTIANGLTPWCAGIGYDRATGWGSFNALQLSWYINTYLAGDFGSPVAAFAGPQPGLWYNTDQTIRWIVSDTSANGSPAIGVAGYSQAWDADPGDAYSQATPGQGNSFYSGPQFPNATTGALSLAAAGQGCHTAFVRAWDNAGWPGLQTRGPFCYDIVPPFTLTTLIPSANALNWNNTPVQVSMVALDPGDKSVASGVFASFYAVDAACSWSNLAVCSIYSAPFNITTEGVHNVYDFSSDNAGNAESPNIYAVNIDMTTPVSSASLSGNNPVVVTLIASDSLSGVANTTYQLDGGTPTTYAGPITVSATGSHRVTYYSTDNAGNVEAPPKSVTFTVSSAQVTIDDFTSGAYQSPVFKNGLKHLSSQNGIMLGGNRYTNMSLCKPGACGGANPFNQGVSYAFLPATASAPATMLQSAGYGSAPRIDLEYGQGTPMNADLSTSDRIRITFLGSTGTLNFNLLIYTGGSFGQNGCNLAASTVPFTVELPFSGFAGPGFTSSNINTLDFIFQNGSPIGGINFAIGSIQAVNGGQPGAIVCHLN